MKKLIFIFSLIAASHSIHAQEAALRTSVGLNAHRVFTVNFGFGYEFKHVVAEANMIVSGFKGQNEPASFGGSIGYSVVINDKLPTVTPFIGRYYSYMSADKTSLNKWVSNYGVRIEKDVVFAEYDYLNNQSQFLIGLKIIL